MAKVKTITNVQATTISALWATEGEQVALDALAKLGYTREQLGEKLAHMAKVGSKNSNSGKTMENAIIADKIVKWLGELGKPATSAMIMQEFGLNSSAKVSIVLRDVCSNGIVVRGREDTGKVNYRVE